MDRCAIHHANHIQGRPEYSWFNSETSCIIGLWLLTVTNPPLLWSKTWQLRNAMAMILCQFFRSEFCNFIWGPWSFSLWGLLWNFAHNRLAKHFVTAIFWIWMCRFKWSIKVYRQFWVTLTGTNCGHPFVTTAFLNLYFWLIRCLCSNSCDSCVQNAGVRKHLKLPVDIAQSTLELMFANFHNKHKPRNHSSKGKSTTDFCIGKTTLQKANRNCHQARDMVGVYFLDTTLNGKLDLDHHRQAISTCFWNHHVTTFIGGSIGNDRVTSEFIEITDSHITSAAPRKFEARDANGLRHTKLLVSTPD